MRILQISSAKNFGGGERHFIDLCRGLIEKGHDVSVVVRRDADWLEQLSFLPSKKIIHLSLRNSLDLLSAWKLAKIIRRCKIQIVHAHLARDYSPAAVAVRLTKPARLVLTRHVFFPLNFSYKLLLPKDTVFIAPTAAGKLKLLEQNILPSKQVRLIYYGIDSSHFIEIAKTTDRGKLREQLKLPAGNPLVGIAGEITEHKGQLDFVRATAEVLKTFPETEFLVIGQDSTARKTYQYRIEALISKLRLTNKFHLLGFWTDVAPLYSLLDIFVSASHVEPFGLVIAEASASGCAVVATATDGAKEIIIDGQTGKIVSLKDAQAIAKAICEFLGDEANRVRSAKNARQRIEENFSLREMIEKTEQLYKNILSENI